MNTNNSHSEDEQNISAYVELKNPNSSQFDHTVSFFNALDFETKTTNYGIYIKGKRVLFQEHMPPKIGVKRYAGETFGCTSTQLVVPKQVSSAVDRISLVQPEPDEPQWTP